MKEAFVHLAHILLFSTFLGYVGIMKTDLPKIFYPILVATGLLVIGYHIYKSLFKKDGWVNYIHIFIVGPLLLYVGLQKEDTPRKIFELILMLAFASLGYHCYYLLQ